ncbi:MAG TPA: endonuclease/exonuclease/phosphatase family protein [Candidatus Ozemobacteraceae bacterium]|nr:endonuclease/exonuclease/phosphatase family protein [Candidatus Ozemobacteraceae bacterium]
MLGFAPGAPVRLAALLVGLILCFPMAAFPAKPVAKYLPPSWKSLRSLDLSMSRNGIGKLLVGLAAPDLVPSPEELAAGLKQPVRFPAASPRSSDPARFAADPVVVRVLTANLFLLPPPFAADHEARMDEFARMVRGRNPDLILVQEVWLEGYLAGLRARLPEYDAFAPEPALRNPTGLAIFSRLPVGDARYRLYPSRLDFNMEEKLADKGFLAVECSIGDRPFWIVNTHLYAHKGELERSFTEAQFDTVKEFCAGLDGAVILGGDMNMEPSVLFPRLGGMFSVEPEGGRTAVRGGPERRIDYVMTRSSADWHLAGRSEVVTEPIVSDHFPVSAEITLHRGMAGAVPGPSMREQRGGASTGRADGVK